MSTRKQHAELRRLGGRLLRSKGNATVIVALKIADLVGAPPAGVEAPELAAGITAETVGSASPALPETPPIVLDPLAHCVKAAGKRITFGPSQMRLLAAVARTPGVLMSRQALQDELGLSTTQTNYLVTALRHKLPANLFNTLRGQGLIWYGPPAVSELPLVKAPVFVSPPVVPVAPRVPFQSAFDRCVQRPPAVRGRVIELGPGNISSGLG